MKHNTGIIKKSSTESKFVRIGDDSELAKRMFDRDNPHLDSNKKTKIRIEQILVLGDGYFLVEFTELNTTME